MKIFKIILLNVLLLILVFSISEFILFKSFQKKTPDTKYEIRHVPYKNVFFPDDKFRHTLCPNSKKRPIIILGCSFAWGYNLEEKDTISYKLSKLTNRSVYNYAMRGKGLQNSLFFIQNKLFSKDIKDPEYVIYVMMSDHIRRLYSNVCPSDFVGQPIYKFNSFGRPILVKDYFPIYKQFYTYYYINNFIFNKFLVNDYQRHNKYITGYFREMKRYITKQYPDIKFVILMYGDKNSYGLDTIDLEEDGFIILHSEDITGVDLNDIKYKFSYEDTHPLPIAWDIVAKALKDTLKL